MLYAKIPNYNDAKGFGTMSSEVTVLIAILLLFPTVENFLLTLSNLLYMLQFFFLAQNFLSLPQFQLYPYLGRSLEILPFRTLAIYYQQQEMILASHRF